MDKKSYKELHSAIRDDLRRYGRWSCWTIETWDVLSNDEQWGIRNALQGPPSPLYGLWRLYEYAEHHGLSRIQISDLRAVDRRYRSNKV